MANVPRRDMCCWDRNRSNEDGFFHGKTKLRISCESPKPLVGWSILPFSWISNYSSMGSLLWWNGQCVACCSLRSYRVLRSTVHASTKNRASRRRKIGSINKCSTILDNWALADCSVYIVIQNRGGTDPSLSCCTVHYTYLCAYLCDS